MLEVVSEQNLNGSIANIKLENEAASRNTKCYFSKIKLPVCNSDVYCSCPSSLVRVFWSGNAIDLTNWSAKLFHVSPFWQWKYGTLTWCVETSCKHFVHTLKQWNRCFRKQYATYQKKCLLAELFSVPKFLIFRHLYVG